MRSTFLLSAILLFMIVMLRKIVLGDLQSLFPQGDWNQFFWVFIILTLGAALALFFGLMSFVFYSFLVPFGLLFSKVKSIENRGPSEVEDEAFLETFDPGEWSDLETSISKLGEDLAKSRRKVQFNKQTMSTLLSILPQGIVAIDPELQILFFNSAFSDLFGIRSEFSGPLVELIRAPPILEAAEKSLRQGEVNQIHYQL